MSVCVFLIHCYHMEQVLVKKKYRVGKHRRARQRRWKLRQLAIEEPDAAPTKAVERARAEEREAFYQVS